MPTHIRKGDEVVIRSGEYKGRTGTVVRVMHKSERVIVKGAGIEGIVRTLKPTRINPQGGQVTVDRSFHMSAVSPAVDGKPTRVRFEVKKDGSKVRVAARGGKELSVVHGPRKTARSKKSK
jgi:large subunit ribosomal protein L24